MTICYENTQMIFNKYRYQNMQTEISGMIVKTQGLAKMNVFIAEIWIETNFNLIV